MSGANQEFAMLFSVLHCPEPPPIVNGRYTFSPGMDWRYGGTLRYSCDRGYVINGFDHNYCQKVTETTANWENPAPTCESK